jgi:hypothetical protein
VIAARENDPNPEKPRKNREPAYAVGYKRPPKEHRFKPGNNGNVDKGGGRPKGESLTTKLRRVLDEPDETYGTKADKLIAAAVEAAGNSDVRYFKEILERIDGPVPVRIANADGSNINLLPVRLDGDRDL